MQNSHYLGVWNNVVIIMAEATGAPNKLAEHNVAKWVSPPTIRVSSLDRIRLVPALLLHTVREASRVIRVGQRGGTGRDFKPIKLVDEVLGSQVAVLGEGGRVPDADVDEEASLEDDEPVARGLDTDLFDSRLDLGLIAKLSPAELCFPILREIGLDSRVAVALAAAALQGRMGTTI
ncbi:hypothetical protein Dimus_004911 [Dionaea muscipula]